MEKFDVVNAALAALRAVETCELVVVAGTAGSSPRGVGAWMAVFADGSQAGTIGGGKIELFALDEARELLSAGQSRLVRYTMGGENSDTGMICGGAICLCYLHLDATQAPLFQEIADVLVYRRIGDFVIDFGPFIASALEGDVAEYQATIVDTGHPFGRQRAGAVIAGHDGKARRREHARRRGAHVSAAKDVGQALGAERLDVRRGNLRGSVGVGDVTPLLHQ